MELLVFLFIVCVGGGWLVGKLVGGALLPGARKKDAFIDRSVHHHHHYHDNRSINIDSKEFRNLKK